MVMSPRGLLMTEALRPMQQLITIKTTLGDPITNNDSKSQYACMQPWVLRVRSQ